MKISTAYPPKEKPIMIWDGGCTFCKFWKERWELMSNGKIDFESFRIASDSFPDIKIDVFQRAVALITREAQVYLAAAAVFKSFELMGRYCFLNRYYHKYSWFRDSSEAVYRFIAGHRNLMMRLTFLFFGRNPKALRPYWLIYLLVLLLALFGAVNFW